MSMRINKCDILINVINAVNANTIAKKLPKISTCYISMIEKNVIIPVIKSLYSQNFYQDTF